MLFLNTFTKKMKVMRNTVFCFIFVLQTSILCAQFELPKRKIGIAAQPFKQNPKTEVNPSANNPIKFESSILKKEAPWQSVSNLPKVGEIKSEPKEAPRNPSELFANRFNKSEGVVEERFKSDTFLGEFRSGSKTIKIACRDHEAVDGDRVRIWLNGEVIANDIFLGSAFRELFFDLKQGFNVLEFEALNQGESGPNTAQFVMFGDDSKLITSNIWNLTTGVKAKVILVKENNTIRKME